MHSSSNPSVLISQRKASAPTHSMADYEKILKRNPTRENIKEYIMCEVNERKKKK